MSHSPRRELLKATMTAGLSPLFWPFLQQVQVQAAGPPLRGPQRFLFVVKCSGLTPAQLVPQ